ncbi:MAG: FxsA family protein [Candidatus Omnitrophica bacterium]|nr:FxsA family protein [Candidatus Omnitrophota bacterium]
MGLFIFLLFVAFPVAEVIVLGKVISRIGFGDTMILLLFSAVFGAYLAKLQGKATLIRVQQALAEGRVPTSEMIDGLMIFLGGILFIIPGFISDILGFFLLFPVTRWCAKWIFLRNVKSAYGARSARGEVPQPKSYEGFSARKGDAEDAEIVE